MIARIRGPVLNKQDGFVIVEAGGLGYKIRIPESNLIHIELQKETILYTELIVRQDQISLYGFQTPEEVELFRLLISVSHIGPQTGLALLSKFSVQEICDAISCKKPDKLSQVQGLGKKGAERIILELQNKVPEFIKTTSHSTLSSCIQDTVLALQSLGYTHEESIAAIEKIQDYNSSMNSSELVKEALKHLRKK